MKRDGHEPVEQGRNPAPLPDVSPAAPQRIAHLLDAPGLEGVWEDRVAAHAAEARAYTRLLDHRAEVLADAAGQHLFARSAADKSAVHQAAQLLGVADRTAAVVLNVLGLVREDLPKTWQIYTQGLIDLPRVRRVADAVTDIPPEHREVLTTLDRELAQVAPEKTAAELKHWLNRRIPELDAEAYQQRCQEALAQRYVRIEHLGDGTSFLEARLPTLEAAVIEKRLKKVAACMDIPQPASPPDVYPHAHLCPDESDAGESDPAAIGHHEDHPHIEKCEFLPATGEPVDGRTRTQREADLLSVWLRTGTSYGTPVDARICVLIPEATLTQDADAPATSADRSWALPADQARKLAADPQAEHQWYTAESRHNPTEADHDILTTVYHGRFAPPRLRDALIFRDGVCQASGCTVPAERCDLDHQQPHHQDGKTAGTNMWSLCRRHHQMKSHGYLPVPAREPPQKRRCTPAA